jgi:hypothetical protein
VVVTLMACYGSPPCDDDNDGDGDCHDCNDQDPSINERADDPKGDGIDQNCDGVDGYYDDEETDGGGGGMPDAGDGGMSDGGDGGMPCLICGEAPFNTPEEDLCMGASRDLFVAFRDCVCTASCAAVCLDNACQGVEAPPDCIDCMLMQCVQQYNDCANDL